MDSVPAESKQVRVNIFNQTYTIITSTDPAEVQALAQSVDEIMRSYARTGNIDAGRIAVLACLHLADQLRARERELAEIKGRVDEKSRALTLLIDSAIE